MNCLRGSLCYGGLACLRVFGSFAVFVGWVRWFGFGVSAAGVVVLFTWLWLLRVVVRLLFDLLVVICLWFIVVVIGCCMFRVVMLIVLLTSLFIVFGVLVCCVFRFAGSGIVCWGIVVWLFDLLDVPCLWVLFGFECWIG